MRLATLAWIAWALVVVGTFAVMEVSALRRGVVHDTATWPLVELMRTHPFWAAMVPAFFLGLGGLIAIHLVIEYFRLGAVQ